MRNVIAFIITLAMLALFVVVLTGVLQLLLIFLAIVVIVALLRKIPFIRKKIDGFYSEQYKKTMQNAAKAAQQRQADTGRPASGQQRSNISGEKDVTSQARIIEDTGGNPENSTD